MKSNPIPGPVAALLITGILLAVLPFALNTSLHLPDSVLGLITGVGISLEILAVLKMRRNKSHPV